MKKKFTIVLAIMLLAVSLTACASSKTEQAVTGSNPVSADADMQLIVGTLLLDNTENEVSIEQAASLLPLWQVYSNLLASDTTAQEEIDAVLTQIQKTMTDTQIAAIGKIDLAGQNSMSLLRESGLLDQLGFDPAENFASESEVPDGFTIPQGGDEGDFRPQAGDFPAGGGPGRGLGGGAGQDLAGMDPGVRATQMAESGNTVPAGRNSQIFLQLLISYLEFKVIE